MATSGRSLIRPALIALLVALGLAEAILSHLWNPGRKFVIAQGIYALATGAIVLFLGRRPMATPRWGVGAVLAGGFVLTVLVAQFALHAYPSSGDEYGYNYVANTLAHGRLWNQAYPLPLRDVLETFYVGGHGDQRLSQYIPGWPVVLIPFQLIGLPQVANAVVGLLAAIFLLRALQTLGAPPAVRLALLILGVAAPFTLFNDASFFNHPLTAAALLGIIWLDLRDPAHPSALNRVGIGFGFSVLLATRYETFLLAFMLFAVDGLIRHRLRFVRWALPAAMGAAPVTLLLLAYNWRITGSPFTTTLGWVSPDIGFGLRASGIDGAHSARRGLEHSAVWLGSWQEFASVLLLPMYALALGRRIMTRTVRWFDLLLPLVVAFFFFYPDDGGFQYGPRYWYLAHAAMPVTIAAGLPLAGGFWSFGRFRFDPMRLAAIQLASFAGFALGFAVFLHLQIEKRLVPWNVAAAAPPPAMVLMANQAVRYVPWQVDPYAMLAKDYTHNGIGELGPVVMAIDLGDERTALLCRQVPDRALYRIRFSTTEPTGSLIPVCNGPAAERISVP